MAIKGMYHGNVVFWRNPIGKKPGWYYEDGSSVKKPRPCPHCGKLPTPEGHDGCLGTLPGVSYACCGHGGRGYIKFENGKVLRFEKKIKLSEEDL